MQVYLEGLASMVSQSTDALSVKVLRHLISLGLEGAVNNDRGHALQRLLLQQLQNGPLGCPTS